MIVPELPLAKIVDLDSTPISIMGWMGTIALIHRHHCCVLGSFITILHSTTHAVCHQPPIQVWNVAAFSNSGRVISYTNMVIAGISQSPLQSGPGTGCDLQVPQEWLQDCYESIQSIGQNLSHLLFYQNLFLMYMADHPLAFQWHDSGHQRNNKKHMSQGSRICPHWRWSSWTNMMEMKRLIIHQTLAVWRAYSLLAWSKPNLPWSNFSIDWGWLTAVCTSHGRKYGWLHFWQSSVAPWPTGGQVCNNFEMYSYTGNQQLMLFWQYLQTGCHGIASLMMNWLAGSGLKCVWRYVQVTVRSQWKGQYKTAWDCH